MSNCSAKAMQPKEQPRTCGTCGHSCEHNTKLYGCVYDYVPCLLHGTFEHEENSCSDWQPSTGVPVRRNGKALEQRFQQLEQVAKRLYRYVKKDADESWSPAKEKVARNFEEELKAIGVNLNES